MILLAALAPMLAGAEPAWRWVDANGVVHYSDRPVPGAVEVDLPTSARGTSVVATTSSRAAAPAQAPQAAQSSQPYTRLDIVSPTQQETLWNIGATLDVQVAVEPQLQPGHQLDIVYDGERRRLVGTGTTLTLEEVYRGIHTIQAVIVDLSDTIVLRSAPVEFMVQQTSLRNPNNPNSPFNRPNPPPANNN